MNSEKPDYDRIINFANDDKEQLRFGVGHFVDVFCKNKEVISGIIINYDLGEETLFLQSEDYYPHLFIAFGAIDKIIVYEEAKRITYGKVRYIGPTTTYSNGITLYQNELYECLDLMKTTITIMTDAGQQLSLEYMNVSEMRKGAPYRRIFEAVEGSSASRISSQFALDESGFRKWFES